MLAFQLATKSAVPWRAQLYSVAVYIAGRSKVSAVEGLRGRRRLSAVQWSSSHPTLCAVNTLWKCEAREGRLCMDATSDRPSHDDESGEMVVARCSFTSANFPRPANRPSASEARVLARYRYWSILLLNIDILPRLLVPLLPALRVLVASQGLDSQRLVALRRTEMKPPSPRVLRHQRQR